MANTVLITGCSTGIGRATAERFADAEWEVYATARDEDDVRDLRRRGCRTAELDVSDRSAVDAVVDRAFEEQGQLDCLVNNAGYGQFGPVEDVPLEKVERQFDVNTFGPLRLVHAALPRMRERGRGTIVNVGAAVSALTPPGIGVYTGSKYALHSLTDALRQEVSGTGVDVTLVQPGATATPFYDRAVEEAGNYDRAVEEAGNYDRAVEEAGNTDRTPAYADLYRVLDEVGVVRHGGPGINPPERVAETIFEAGSTDSPKAVYRAGPLSYLGTLAGVTVRGRVRDAASRALIRGLASEPIQRLLKRWQ